MPRHARGQAECNGEQWQQAGFSARVKRLDRVCMAPDLSQPMLRGSIAPHPVTEGAKMSAVLGLICAGVERTLELQKQVFSG